jgi:hypothetical protein
MVRKIGSTATFPPSTFSLSDSSWQLEPYNKKPRTSSVDHMSSSPKVQAMLSRSMFPHLFALVLAFSGGRTMLKLRETSKDVRDQVDKLLFRHLVVQGEELRTRVGGLRASRGDTRAMFATAVDTTGGTPCPATSSADLRLSNVSLVRLKNSEYASRSLLSDFAQRTQASWIVQHIDAHACQDSDELILEFKSTQAFQHHVVNISYYKDDPPFTGTAFVMYPRFSLSNRSHYIMFTPRTKPSSSDADLQPSDGGTVARSGLINSLSEWLVSGEPTKVYLIDIDKWEHSWLDRTSTLGMTGPQVKETTTTDAAMSTRLRWWIAAAAREKLGAGKVQQALDNVRFITLDQFRSMVPTAEMFNEIVNL